ncbi:MAG: tetratricopeptide repeat protein [Bacteroidia bacterium]|nr:tetratricopeptide repeat protein [Bacteroidia bacterium]
MKYKKYNNFSKTVTILLIGIVIMWSCNPNKEKWLNKKWHSLVGHYNIYFNGEIKLNEAIATLNAGHVNDFNKILDVFPYGNEVSAKGVANFLDDAMKKFSGTIQLHKVGSHTDEAWFAIAKTHYFKRDYYACQEAMQYMISKYPEQYKDISTSWIAKSYMGLGKPQEAEAVIGLLLSSKNIAKKDITEIYLTAAYVNIKLEKYQSAIENLNKVINEGSLNKEEKIRYRYILGQLYMQANDNKNALLNFNKVINLVPSYDFGFNANINITKLYDVNDKKSVNKVRRSLKKMANDDKNIDYLSKIYFEIGKLELSQKNNIAAIAAFKKSNEKSSTMPIQKPKTCYELAKIYFEIKDYKNARAYYDSAANLYDKNDKLYGSILSTKNVLSDLINNLEVYEAEDSLQELSKLDKVALTKKVNEWIAADKRKKELVDRESKRLKQIEVSMAANQAGKSVNNIAPQAFDNSPGGSQWYFYNTNLVATGLLEFVNSKKWGNRINEDFWRLSTKEKSNKQTDNTSDDEDEKNTAEKTNIVKKDLEPDQTNLDSVTDDKKDLVLGDKVKDEWIKNVPFTTAAMENSNLSMMEALHNLGNIYYNKIKNYKEAITYLNILENRFPKNEYEPEAWYYLHKSHDELKEKKNASKYKDDLLQIYPENPYTLLLLGKPLNTISTDQNKDLIKLYDSTFEAYKAERFAEVKALKILADKKYPGNNFRPKFEYINALAIGKTENIENFKLALTSVTKEFPKTDVAAQAQEILNILNKTEKRIETVGKDTNMTAFDMEPDAPHYYIMAIKNDKANFTDYVEKIYSYNEAFASLDNLRVNALMGNEGYQYMLVREFSNLKKAEDYYKGIISNNVIKSKLKVTDDYIDFVISANNYKTIMKEKQMEKYYLFYKKLQAKPTQ